MAAHYRSVGLPLRRHPVELLRPQLAARNFPPASVLNGYPDKRVPLACGIVTVHQRPHPPRVSSSSPWRTKGVYGSWQSMDGVRHLIAQRLVDLSDLLGGLSMPSRNFH